MLLGLIYGTCIRNDSATVRLNHREISHEEQIAENPNEIVSLSSLSLSLSLSMSRQNFFFFFFPFPVLLLPLLILFRYKWFSCIHVYCSLRSGSCFDSAGDVCLLLSDFIRQLGWGMRRQGERERERERERDSLAPEARMICGTSVCIVSDWMNVLPLALSPDTSHYAWRPVSCQNR